MKISKIKFENHPILSNLELDFTDSNGGVYDTVVLAGENGTGKTAVLDTIAHLASLDFTNAVFYVRFSESDLRSIIDADRSKMPQAQLFANVSDDEIGRLLSEDIVISRPADRSYGCELVYKVPPSGVARSVRIYPSDDLRQNCFTAFFSKLVAKLKKNDREPTFAKPTNTSDITVDRPNANTKLITANDLDVGQLLVSINYQDASEFQNRARISLSTLTTNDIENRVGRFRFAFNNFFDNGLQFKEISGNDIRFAKDGVVFPMEQLSSGEKLIVQTGAFLLKDINVDEPFFSLLDEPEQSLHPLWEDKILDYYKTILDKSGTQISQLFVVTHSEYVIRDAYEAGDLIIVSKRDHSSGQLKYLPSPQLDLFPFSPTYSEIKYKAFNLVTPDFHIELFGYLHSRLQDNGSCDATIASIDTFLDSVPNVPRIPNSWPNLRHDKTLPVYIRNYFDHPDCARENPSVRQKPSLQDIKQSIEFMMDLLKTLEQQTTS